MARRRTTRGSANRRVLLDTFTENDLEYWSDRYEDAQRYCDRVYFDLERQRAANHEALCDALRGAGGVDVPVDGWARVCDYRWSLAPLSPAGSLKGIGGRFNIGSDLDRARGQQFPALYIAEDVDTAYLEFFGGPPETDAGELKLQEFALRRKTSFTTFTLRGRVENVLDLRASSCLKGFAKIIATFKLSGSLAVLVFRFAHSCAQQDRFRRAFCWRLKYGGPSPSCSAFPRPTRSSVATYSVRDSKE